MPTVVPDAWMPPADMRRVIIHWTAGGHRANDVDRAAYHILVEETGRLVRGTHSILDNVGTADGDYAAHTLGCNTRSIGVSMCCMAGCRQSPFDGGRYPMSERQWTAMLHVVAQLCRRYGIDVTPTTVLGHGEVQANLGIKQKSKWDPMVLPFRPELAPAEVGALLRECVRDLLEPPPRVTVVMTGTAIPEDAAFLQDGHVFVAADDVTRILGWAVVRVDDDEADVRAGRDGTIRVPTTRHAGRTYLSGRELADALDRPARWDPASRTVTIG